VKRVAVIGGGASGLMAACFAAGSGNTVVLFEKQKKIGRKILVSGNGRCNITNSALSAEMYHGKNPMAVNNIFARFGFEDTVAFFRSIGLPLVEEEKGKMFPASLQATAVVRLFEYELKYRGVEVLLHRKINLIERMDEGFRLVTAGREEYFFDSVILSAGSCAYPPAGGSGDGYELARQLKHSVHELFPAILPINIPMKALHRLQGVKWDCAIQVLHDDRVVESSEGELLFTAYGISGPASLDVSRSVNDLVMRKVVPVVNLDLFPGYTEQELLDLLEDIWMDTSKSVGFSLVGILKTPMPEVLLHIAGIDPGRKSGDLSREERRKVAGILKSLSLEPGKPRGFNEAVVAAGGVDMDEIDCTTMESRCVRNLYITGELLDIDGNSGGYNLQFAWSTGAIAGMSQHTT
jgi:predicted Rossmann fold flavoprotein